MDLISRRELNEYLNVVNDYLDTDIRTVRSIKQYVNQMRSVPCELKWTACSDQMPRDGQWAIWVFNDGYIDVARYKFDAIPHFFPPTKSRYLLEDAVAWMPLPKYEVADG